MNTTATTERGAGFIYTCSAFLLWGVLPLYFLLLDPANPFEVVAWRILFSLVFCVLLLAVTRAWRPLLAVFRNPKALWLTALAGALIYVNWQVFVLGAMTGHVLQASLGYFINPIVTILLGVLVLHERLRPMQWAAIAFAGAAVIVIVIGDGEFPWISLTLAASFGVYGLVKNRLGSQVDAVTGLTLETLWLVPLAIVQLVGVALWGRVTFFTEGPLHAGLLALAGVITAVPLLLFAAGTRRIPLSVVGMLQFMAPILQFIVGVQREAMSTERWIGFGIVWVAVLLFIADSLISGRRLHSA